MIVAMIIVHILYRYFDYLFYVDFEASMAASNAQNALRHLNVRFNLMLMNLIEGVISLSLSTCSKTITLYRSLLLSCEC